MHTDISDSITQHLQEAIAHHQAGKLDEAKAEYESVLRSVPDHPVANHNMGVLLAGSGDASVSLSYFIAALNADPAQGQYWLSYIDALMKAGQMEEASQVLELARQHGLQGDKVEALARSLEKENQKLAGPSDQEMDALVALFSQGQYERAAVEARRLAEKFPDQGFVWKGLGVSYKELGRIEEALEPMQKAAALSPLDVEAHYNLGVVLQALGRQDEAASSYRKALEIKPDYVDALINLGVLQHEAGQLNEAERSLRRAFEIMPQNVKAVFNLGNVLMELERYQEAEQIFKSAVQLPGSEGEAYFGLGRALKGQKKLNEAETAYRQSLAFNPDNESVHYNLGNLCKDLERLNEAEASYRRAVNIKPELALAHYNLGHILKRMDRLGEAKDSYRRAIELNPDHAEAHCGLGMVLSGMGSLKEAEISCRKALDINPNYADAHCVLGVIFLNAKKLGEAEASLRRALQIEPDFFEAHNNLSLILKEQGKTNEAISSCLKALEIDPESALSHCNLGILFLAIGQVNESINCFRKALQLKPDYALAHSNLIFLQDLNAKMTVSELQSERRNWDAVHGAPFYGELAHENQADPERKLRIGYMSADFRIHSAAFVFGGMLVNYDAGQFDVIAYSNFATKDLLTERFQESVTLWRDIAGMADDEVAQLIREDGIDILVDLSGHSAGNRLLVFARKPAPIQITAWGYAHGTGMRAMDVFLTDPVSVPIEEQVYYAERIRYLPCVVGYFKNGETPSVNDLPALSGKGITFGSFNRLSKNSEATYRVWSNILKACPESRMVIKTHELNDGGTRGRVMSYFTSAGIDPERIILQRWSPRHEHMQAYNQIDIALDPFPHGGGVTALEGLMMGVPMVSLCWPTTSGRVSASILTALGLTDWIARTEQEYEQLAIKKAMDLQSLSALRCELRNIFNLSVIGDQLAYTRSVEREYRSLWREWCEKNRNFEAEK